MDLLVVNSNMILLATLDLSVGQDDLDQSDNVVSAVINLFASRRYPAVVRSLLVMQQSAEDNSRYRSSALRCYVRIR